MVTPRISLLVVASIAAASFSSSSSTKLAERSLPDASSCEAPLAPISGRRPEGAAAAAGQGHVLLQTRTRNSAWATSTQLLEVASPRLKDDRPTNSAGQLEPGAAAAAAAEEEAETLPDGLSLLTTRLGSWSLAVQAMSARTRIPRVPLGVPGNAASLLAVLAEGARNEPIPKSARSGVRSEVKLAILAALTIVAVLCCLSTYNEPLQKGAAPELDINEALQRAGFEVGREVVAAKTFVTDEETRTHILEQQAGVILRIDKEGDVLVKFKDASAHAHGQWVFSWRVFEVLALVPEGDSESERHG